MPVFAPLFTTGDIVDDGLIKHIKYWVDFLKYDFTEK